MIRSAGLCQVCFDRECRFERIGVLTYAAPCVPYEVRTIMHSSNLLHVSVNHVALEDAASGPTMLASAANKSLYLLSSEPPYDLVRTELLAHNSPILSWTVVRQRYLVSTSMSGHVTLTDTRNMQARWSRHDHMKYVVAVAHYETTHGFWLATAGWDAKVHLYRFNIPRVGTGDAEEGWDSGGPVAAVSLPTNPESLLFVKHPELTQPVLLLTRRDSTFLYYYNIPEDTTAHSPFASGGSSSKATMNIPLLGRQNLAPHSNAWIAFTPSALAIHPTDPSLLAVATSHAPFMKLILVRLLLPPPNPSQADLSSSATAPAVLNDTTGPLTNPTQASEARRLLAIQDREAAAIQLQVSTHAPQTAYSTPALAWRPDGTGVWVNGDDGIVRGVEAKSGKVVAVLKDGHEAGSKVRCLWAGWMGGERGKERQEIMVSGGFDRKLIVWRVDGSPDAGL